MTPHIFGIGTGWEGGSLRSQTIRVYIGIDKSLLFVPHTSGSHIRMMNSFGNMQLTEFTPQKLVISSYVPLHFMMNQNDGNPGYGKSNVL